MRAEELLKGRHLYIFDPPAAGLSAKLSRLPDSHSGDLTPGEPQLPEEGLREKIMPAGLPLSVRLLFPVQRTERRQESVIMPNAHLFLGSALLQQGFRVSCQTVTLGEDPELDLSGTGFIGITVFEENVLAIRELLSKKLSAFRGVIMLGGAFITLAGIDALSYFPQANLFVRGEAELILPELVRIIAGGHAGRLHDFGGILFQNDRLLVASSFGEINRVTDPGKIVLCADLYSGKDISRGLELNLLRGCRRNCVFCAHLQGKRPRALPLANLEHFLRSFRGLAASSSVPLEQALRININDDDILQDKRYFRETAALLQRFGYRIWGVQTSLDSLFLDASTPDFHFLDSLDRNLFVAERIIFWIGTDIFTSSRARHMAKFLPSEAGWEALLQKMEEKAVEHYHYWILSDFASGWEEFLEELFFIAANQRRFPSFAVMPIAPFLIPYAHTPAYRFARSARNGSRIIFRKGSMEGGYPLVERVETPWESLNRMLLKEQLPGDREDFFTLFCNRDYPGLWRLVYYFLKQEILKHSKGGSGQMLRECQQQMEERYRIFIDG